MENLWLFTTRKKNKKRNIRKAEEIKMKEVFGDFRKCEGKTNFMKPIQT
jgi:hypothetical protein